MKPYTSILVILLLITGCSRDKEEFERARTTNTIEAYTHFLDEYPESEFGPKASERIAYLRALDRNRLEVYEAFLRTYPESEETATIRGRLDTLRADLKRLADYVTNLEEDHSQGCFYYAKLIHQMDRLAGNVKANQEGLPTAISDSCFFTFLANCQYVPVVNGELGYRLIIGNTALNRMKTIQSASRLLQMYVDRDLQFEALYLWNALGRLAVLFAAQMPHAKFEEVDLTVIRNRQLSAFVERMNLFAGSRQSVQSFGRSADVAMAEMKALKTLWTIAGLNMFKGIVTAQDAKTRKFVLSQLANWEKFVAPDSASVSKLKEIAELDEDKENRGLASQVLTQMRVIAANGQTRGDTTATSERH